MLSGVQGGKTTGGVVWLSKEVQTVGKDKDYLVVFPTYKIGEQSTIKKFHDWFPRNWGYYIKRDKVFKLKDGGTIYFRSADDPTSLEGITAAAAWIDEAGQLSALAWETIQARLSIRKGRAFLTTTPYIMNWLFHDFYKLWENGHEDYDVIQFSSQDSPWFPKEEYARRAKTLDARRFKLKYKGQFTTFEGLVYPTFNRGVHVIKPHKVPKDAQIICGADRGYTNESAIIWAYKDKDDCLILFREYYKAQKTIKDMAPMMILHSPKIVYVDPSAKQFIEELKRTYGVPNIMGADNDVNNGISRVQALFGAEKIKIFNSCKNLIDELETYHYAENRQGEMSEKVVKKHDHAVDALRYLVNTGVARPTLLTKPKRHYVMSTTDQEWAYGEA